MKRIGSLKVLALFVIVLAMLTVTAQATRYISPWTKIYEGIEYATGSDDYPRLMKAFAIRVSLQNPEVSLYATPHLGALETIAQTTPHFLEAYHTEVAVNANYGIIGVPEGGLQNPEGLLISNAAIVSNDDANHPGQLCFDLDKWPYYRYGGGNPIGMQTAIAGEWLCLDQGNPTGDNIETVPATTLGTTQDGKFLTIVVVDGRRAGWSLGATRMDMGYWQRDFGAYWAMWFDGGGSSCICRANTLNGTANIMNIPSDGSEQGQSYPRPVCANLGAHSNNTNRQGPNACSMNTTRTDICYRGNMNHVYWRKWTTTNGWEDPEDLGVLPNGAGYTTDQPTIVSRGNGYLMVLIRGTDNALWQNYSSDAGSNWSGWVGLSNPAGGLTSGPAACSIDVNNIAVVVRGNNNNIFLKTWNSSTSWSGWTNLGGTATAQPAICKHGADKLHAFYRGTNNYLYHANNVNGSWSAWSSLGVGSMDTGPSACARDTTHMSVFARCTDGTVKVLSWANGTWNTSWNNLGGIDASRPGCAAIANGDMHLLYRNPSDRMSTKAYDASSGQWVADWTDQGSYF